MTFAISQANQDQDARGSRFSGSAGECDARHAARSSRVAGANLVRAAADCVVTPAAKTRAANLSAADTLGFTVPNDERDNAEIAARYLRHVRIVNNACGSIADGMRLWHMCAARGLYALLWERGGHESAIGAPHWLLYSDEQVKRHA